MTEPQLHYYDLGDGVVAFSTTRHGGCSEGEYASMNVNAYCGDSAGHVASNRDALCRTLSLVSADRLIIPHQTHGIEIRQVGSELFALPEAVRQMVLEGVDGVMTRLEGVCVGVSTADCIPVLLYDTEHRAVCAVHAGWRGTVARIAQKAIAEMRAAFGTRPQAVRAVIGPGISKENFEVGDEVYEAFTSAGFDMEAIAERQEKWHIDLPACNRLQLEAAGIAPDHIILSGICTYGHPDDWFSARRQGTASGRIYTGILLRPNQ